MPINVRQGDRDQQFLMPPSVADWPPEDHLAWFIVDVVAEFDLAEFSASYREDGRGGAAYDPALMLATLLYAYCVGERSSRRIERRLVEDVAFRVVAANQTPDHATLARFRRRHEAAIADLFGQVLGLCVGEGLVDTTVVSIDGTTVEANASAWSNRTRQQLAEEILADAERVDSVDDERFGEARGNELPERFAPGADRRARVREALRQLDEQGAANFEAHQADRARNRFLQGYNAQAAVSGDQVIVAAEVTNAANDSTMFVPMVTATEANLEAAGADAPETIAADTGYWSVEHLTVETSAELLITPMPATTVKLDHDRTAIERRANVFAQVEAGSITTEPVFGNIKANLRHRRFSGRGMSAVESEWRLICSVHNLLEMRNRRLAVG